jgi:hypothetical protein
MFVAWRRRERFSKPDRPNVIPAASVRGTFILKPDLLEEARAWIATDPLIEPAGSKPST